VPLVKRGRLSGIVKAAGSLSWYWYLEEGNVIVRKASVSGDHNQCLRRSVSGYSPPPHQCPSGLGVDDPMILSILPNLFIALLDVPPGG